MFSYRERTPLFLNLERFEARVVPAYGDILNTLVNPISTANPDGTHGTFGSSVAISGNIAVVGDPGDSSAGIAQSGHAYLYDLSTGKQLASIASPSPTLNGGFGFAVAIYDKVVAISAPNEINPNGGYGDVYLFPAQTEFQTQVVNPYQTIRNPNTTGHHTGFGTSIAAGLNRLVVGAPSDSETVGTAYLYDLGAGFVTTLRHTPPSGGQGGSDSSDNFGGAVSISQDSSRILIGASGTGFSPTGAAIDATAYVYSGIDGALLNTIHDPSTESKVDLFGATVAISDNWAVIGAPESTVNNKAAAGVAYAYDLRTGVNLLGKLIEPTPAKSDSYGSSVAVAGDRFFVGTSVPANLLSQNTLSFGQVSEYDAPSAKLLGTRANPSASPDGVSLDGFGSHLAVSDGRLLVGAQFVSPSGIAFVISAPGTKFRSQPAPPTIPPLNTTTPNTPPTISFEAGTIPEPLSEYGQRNALYVIVSDAETPADQLVITTSDPEPNATTIGVTESAEIIGTGNKRLVKIHNSVFGVIGGINGEYINPGIEGATRRLNFTVTDTGGASTTATLNHQLTSTTTSTATLDTQINDISDVAANGTRKEETRIVGRNQGKVVFDHTVARTYDPGDTDIQNAIVAARFAIINAGASDVGRVVVGTPTVTTSASTTVSETGRTIDGNDATSTTYIGPAIIRTGNQQQDFMYLIFGGIDTDTVLKTRSTIHQTRTTSTNTTTTFNITLDDTTPASANVPPTITFESSPTDSSVFVVVGDAETPTDQLALNFTIDVTTVPGSPGIQIIGTGSRRQIVFDTSKFRPDTNVSHDTAQLSFTVTDLDGATASAKIRLPIETVTATASTKMIETVDTRNEVAGGTPVQQTRVIGRIGDTIVFDRVIPVVYDPNNPEIASALAEARTRMSAAGVTDILPPQLGQPFTTSTTSVKVIETGRSTSDPTVTTRTDVGPKIILIGDNQSTYYPIAAGGINVDTLTATTTLLHQTRISTTTEVTTTEVSLVRATAPPQTHTYLRAVGTDIGSRIRAFRSDGTTALETSVFEPEFHGGVRVATGDVNGDGTDDVLIAAGDGGGPRIVIINGITGKVIQDFFAFDDMSRVGAFIAAADVNGDGYADYAVTAGLGGGPRVALFDGKTGERLGHDFFAFDANSRLGYTVALGDVNGDNHTEISVGESHGGSEVRIFDLMGKQLASTIAYENSFLGGVNITVADINNDGHDELVTGAGTGGGPRISGYTLSGETLTRVADTFLSDNTMRTGIRIGSAIDGNCSRVLYYGIDGRTWVANSSGMQKDIEQSPFGSDYVYGVWVS